MVVIYALVLAEAAIVLTAPVGAGETVMSFVIPIASLDAVPLQNRVTALGGLVATPEQGRATANRGSQFTTNHPWPCRWEARNARATP